MKKLLLALSVVFLASAGYSQNLKIGVRTGMGYYKLAGELEANESQRLASGFHFAIAGKYNFTSSFGLRAELVYIQKSSLQEYDRFKTVFFLPTASGGRPEKAVVEGGEKFSLKRIYNIFSIPIHAVYKPAKKFEIFAGIDFDFTAGVIGQGNIQFNNGGSAANNDEIFYDQTLNFNYGTDRTGQLNIIGGGDSIIIDYDTDGDGEREKVFIPKSLSAYYYEEKEEKKAYSTFDMALAAGVSYFLNPGLYIRATGNYGLLDTSKSVHDHSQQEFNLDGSYIYRDDYDRKIGFQVSLGFQF